MKQLNLRKYGNSYMKSLSRCLGNISYCSYVSVNYKEIRIQTDYICFFFQRDSINTQ